MGFIQQAPPVLAFATSIQTVFSVNATVNNLVVIGVGYANGSTQTVSGLGANWVLVVDSPGQVGASISGQIWAGIVQTADTTITINSTGAALLANSSEYSG